MADFCLHGNEPSDCVNGQLTDRFSRRTLLHGFVN